MKFVSPPGIVYESETDEQAAERDRRVAQHNAAVDAEIARWQPGPMRGYEKWIKKHAPHLLSGRASR